MTHNFQCRVYYEDTDLAGIVYYANYLKFIERARSEIVRAAGVDQTALRTDQGVVLAVRRVEADYVLPAKFGDLLDVRTEVQDSSGATLTLWQSVYRGQDKVFDAVVTLVALTAGGKPTRIPAEIRQIFSA
jgi:acyl-CoA thioester hydrolase